jgi:hypothetical protein
LSRTREKALNDAIASADPNVGFEPFACAYIEFYHSDAQVKIENRELQGQQKVFSALMSLLTLLDLEFGSALKRLQLLSEGVDEAGLHVSRWQLRVDGPRTVRIGWRAARAWKEGKIMREVIQEVREENR